MRYSLGWFPNWHNEVVVVVAAGPTAFDYKLLDLGLRAKVIAVNNMWKFTRPDVLYATDSAWWKLSKGVPQFHGLKVTGSRKHLPVEWDVERVPVVHRADPLRTWLTLPTLGPEQRGRIGSGGNSGFQALNVGIQFGARRFILVGFDMQASPSGKLHCHGDHPRPLNNPEQWWFDKCAATLDKQVPRLEANGIHVINVTTRSALQRFPQTATLEKAFDILSVLE